MSSNFTEIIDIGRHRNDRHLISIGLFAQCIEDQVYDGHPFVYPNIRVLYEELIDYIVFDKMKLRYIIDKDNGYTSETLIEYLDEIGLSGNYTATLLQAFPLPIKQRDALKLYVKERIVQYLYKEMGLEFGFFYDGKDKSKEFRQILNVESHGFFFAKPDKLFAEISQIFSVLMNFHDTMYTTFIKSIAQQMKVLQYQFPSSEERKIIVDKFVSRTTINK